MIALGLHLPLKRRSVLRPSSGLPSSLRPLPVPRTRSVIPGGGDATVAAAAGSLPSPPSLLVSGSFPFSASASKRKVPFRAGARPFSPIGRRSNQRRRSTLPPPPSSFSPPHGSQSRHRRRRRRRQINYLLPSALCSLVHSRALLTHSLWVFLVFSASLFFGGLLRLLHATIIEIAYSEDVHSRCGFFRAPWNTFLRFPLLLFFSVPPFLARSSFRRQ